MFNGGRLSIARRRRGLTKKKLASLVGVQPRSVSAFENNEFEPGEETRARLAEVVGFPAAFFEGDDLEEPHEDTASFRSMARMSASHRHAALAAGALAFALGDWVESRFQMPPVDLLDLRGEEPEMAAASLRQHWGIGERPIRNMVHLLEAKGVRVFSLVEDNVEVDAFSLWRGDVPYVFLNTIKSAEHSRFDAAHELGHLVLHKHGGPKGQGVEKEAHAFAAAFLMPKSTVQTAAPFLATVDDLIRLKSKWIVSVAALAHRLHELGRITDWHYRTLCIELSERGFRKKEPMTVQRETSQVWDKVFSSLREEGVTKDIIARNLNIPAAEIEKLVFGLVLMTVSSPQTLATFTAKSRAKLRLVK